MIKLLGVLLAIIFHRLTSLHAHALPKREVPRLTDTDHGLIFDPPINHGNLWLEEDGQIRYLQDYVKNANEHPRSRLLSSLTDNFKELKEQPHPDIRSSQQAEKQDSSPHIKQQQQRDHEGEEEVAGRQETDKVGEYNEQNGKPYEDDQQGSVDREHYEENYRKRQEEKYQKPKVHLFSPPTSQLRENLGQFKHQNSRAIEFQATDLQNMRQNQPDHKMADNNPRLSRSDRPINTHFSYVHPEEWSLDNPECSGRLQSPVNLDSDKLVGLEVPSSLIWTGYWNQPQNLTIIDNGHSVELSGTWDGKTAPFISGGPLVGDYLFAQLHFHWGPKDSVGSEHTINNNSFPMEMHMVHYKKDYGTLKNALKYDDGLAVIAFLFEISETSNIGINLLEDSLSKIQNKPRVKIPVKPYPLAFLHFTFQEDYASYIGSLTTPPCREIVTWLVSSTPLTISRKQLESFRKISNKWSEKENYRPRQALNGRHLYYVAR